MKDDVRKTRLRPAHLAMAALGIAALAALILMATPTAWDHPWGQGLPDAVRAYYTVAGGSTFPSNSAPPEQPLCRSGGGGVAHRRQRPEAAAPEPLGGCQQCGQPAVHLLLKRGGMMLEMGNFADTGEVSINLHRHVCSKNIRLIGITNHPSTGYGPALALMERYADRYPLEEMVSHEFGLNDVDTAMRMSMSPESLKVAMTPNGPVA